jgi:hypothetical protein
MWRRWRPIGRPGSGRRSRRARQASPDRPRGIGDRIQRVDLGPLRLDLGGVGIKLIRLLGGPRLHVIDLSRGIGLELAHLLSARPATASVFVLSVLEGQIDLDLEMGMVDPLLEPGPILRCRLTEASLAFFSRLSSWLEKCFPLPAASKRVYGRIGQSVVASSNAFSRSFSSARICFLSSFVPRVTAASTRASLSCAATTRRPL